MDLRELKKEVAQLPSIEQNLQRFQDHWIKPLRTNTNSHLPFIQNLDAATKKELNKRLVQLQDHLASIKSSQALNHKLQQYSRYLVELKLTGFNGDRQKSTILTNQLQQDEFLSLTTIAKEIQAYEEKVIKLSEHYEEINELLRKKLSLEETLFFLELPHKQYLYNLLRLSTTHKKIARDLERHFLTISAEQGLKKAKL